MQSRGIRIPKWMHVGIGLMMAGMLGACAATASGAGQSPQATVTAFYEWYSGFEGSPMGGGAYRESEYLSTAFVRKIDALVASFEDQGGGYDPFICAQDRPSEINVVEVEEAAESARVTVEAWAPIYVDLVLQGSQWQITDIHCTPPQAPNN